MKVTQRKRKERRRSQIKWYNCYPFDLFDCINIVLNSLSVCKIEHSHFQIKALQEALVAKKDEEARLLKEAEEAELRRIERNKELEEEVGFM